MEGGDQKYNFILGYLESPLANLGYKIPCLKEKKMRSCETSQWGSPPTTRPVNLELILDPHGKRSKLIPWVVL